MESGGLQGLLSPPTTPLPLQAQQGEMHLAGGYYRTNPAGGRFLLHPNSPLSSIKEQSSPLFCLQFSSSLLAWVCNSLLFPNKPIFAGKNDWQFYF